ncbi:hypothetical protein ABRP17_013280 [Stenotrophomonas sp. WHRI 8082]|uniref:hypothetical protein n=1 Tax=Stenotrophomonas sp. WHRI 8082 TaxID=3162571 RepID=UPI0032F01C56
MRGQRPALASLLAWVAMLALLLGSLAVVSHESVVDVPSALLQMPVEERGGGELPLHESAPAKLRRTALAAEAPRSAPTTATEAGCLRGWTILIAAAIAAPADSRDWRHASAQPRRADAPGRRQQRGQAPPLA